MLALLSAAERAADQIKSNHSPTRPSRRPRLGARAASTYGRRIVMVTILSVYSGRHSTRQAPSSPSHQALRQSSAWRPKGTTSGEPVMYLISPPARPTPRPAIITERLEQRISSRPRRVEGALSGESVHRALSTARRVRALEHQLCRNGKLPFCRSLYLAARAPSQNRPALDDVFAAGSRVQKGSRMARRGPRATGTLPRFK